ncbi:MAG: PHP domain-containing protein [Candidatus Bathyarchaeia archaeon]
MVQADLHFHTCYSPDATNNPKHVVEKLNRHPTLKAIAITDHNTTEGYHKTRELAKAYKDILIIPGVEVSAEEGEIILLGAEELPPRPWTASNIIAYAKQNDILTIAAHPYRGLGMGDQALNFDLDAIETLNGITSKSLNQKAEKLAAAKGLPGVAGSDSHFPHDPWNAYTEVDAALDFDEILAAIRKGAVKTFLR